MWTLQLKNKGPSNILENTKSSLVRGSPTTGRCEAVFVDYRSYRPGEGRVLRIWGRR
jgi:hypothetical protein